MCVIQNYWASDFRPDIKLVCSLPDVTVDQKLSNLCSQRKRQLVCMSRATCYVHLYLYVESSATVLDWSSIGWRRTVSERLLT